MRFSRRLRAAVCVVAGGVAIAASAAGASSQSTGRETASSGAWHAALTYTRKGAGPQSYSGLHLTLTNGGALVLDAPVTSRLRGTAYLQPGGYGGQKTLSFRDLDGDGVPELLLVLFTGGAHCCVIEQVYDLSGAAPRRSEISFADAGAKIVQAGGRPVFKTADMSFAYVFTDFADSGAPILLWSYSDGRFRDVTRAFPALVAKDEAYWWKSYRQRLKPHGDERGILAAWAADKALLGQAAYAKKTLLRLAFAGVLDRGFGPPKGSTYVRRLWTFLRSEHYLR